MASDSSASWQSTIRKDLINLYKDDQEDVVNLLAYLDGETHEDGQLPHVVTPRWQSMKSIWEDGSKELFSGYADKMVEEAKSKSAIILPQGQESSNGVALPVITSSNLPAVIYQYLRHIKIHEHGGAAIGFSTGLALVWDTLPKETQAKFIEIIVGKCYEQICTSTGLSIVNTVSGTEINKVSGTQIMYTLAICTVVIKCWINVSRWYYGEVTGKRCAKLCVDCIVEFSAGFCGALAGAALGAMVNPIFAAFLGAFLGVLSGAAAKKLADYLTLKIFDLPKNMAVENAFTFLEINHNASTKQIQVAYEAKCVEVNKEPDQQTRAQQVAMLQIHMAIIENSQAKRYCNTSHPMIKVE